MHPSQFSPNEAWIFFKLNDAPVSTERDGDFDVFALMDAASLFILSSEFVPIGSLSSAASEIQTLLKAAHSHHSTWPGKLLIPQAAPTGKLVAEAEALGISVVAVREAELSTFTKEAQQGLKAHLGGGGHH